MNAVLENFIHQVQKINDEDYGDFMIATNNHLLDLKHELDRLPYEDIHKKAFELQIHIQFCPNWIIKSTRELILEDMEYIDELLAGHKQDWES